MRRERKGKDKEMRRWGGRRETWKKYEGKVRTEGKEK